ncbi:MAG: hypothetical protein KAY24_04855, partial [Candidatus Eisenbacteria sp.]|nr:hypothetical protein [Candidatus Eisenbacteria bacterium]
MSLYTLAVNPMRRLVNSVGRVAETADPGIRVPATAGAATASPAAPVVPGAATASPAAPVAAVPTKLLR